MNENMVALLAAVTLFLIVYIPDFVSWLFPNVSEEQTFKLIELLTQLIKLIMEQITVLLQ